MPHDDTPALGVLQGVLEDGVRVFHGVPFAQPPVGPLRFRARRPMRPWTETRDAGAAGPASIQVNLPNAPEVMRLADTIDPAAPGIPSWPAYVGETYSHETISEDCLYLDIWAPPAPPGAKLPVYLYYHGGTNAVSSGSFTLERGANLAAQETMIVVRPNYRLGALGWVHFGLLCDALPEAVNLGLQDQVAALQWVRDHITAFGGDPDNITIGGESCGATAVSHLLTHPGARTLFRRAIIQSLSPFNVWCTQERRQAEFVVHKYLHLLGIDDPAELLSIDPARLLAVQSVMTRFLRPDDNVAWRPLGGVVDGDWIPSMPAAFLAHGNVEGVGTELMIGFAKDEWQFFRGHSDTIRHGSRADALGVLGQIYGGEAASELFDAYERLHPMHDNPGHILSDIMSFEFFKFSSLLIARNYASYGIAAYVFQFAFDLPGWGGELRAVHTGDMPFLWRNYTVDDLRQWPSFDGIDLAALKRTSDNMGRHYAGFIRDGQPGSGWAPFDIEQQTILSFGKEVAPVPGLLTGELEAFAAVKLRDVGALERQMVESQAGPCSGVRLTELDVDHHAAWQSAQAMLSRSAGRSFRTFDVVSGRDEALLASDISANGGKRVGEGWLLLSIPGTGCCGPA